MDSIIDHYTTIQVANISGFTVRRIDYWASNGMLVPSISQSHGPGTRKLYSFDDLVRVQMIRQIHDKGWSIQKIRKALKRLDEIKSERSDYQDPKIISFQNMILILCETKESETKERRRIYYDALSPSGQQVMWVILETLRAETREKAAQLLNMSELDFSGSSSSGEKRVSS